MLSSLSLSLQNVIRKSIRLKLARSRGKKKKKGTWKAMTRRGTECLVGFNTSLNWRCLHQDLKNGKSSWSREGVVGLVCKR